MKKRKRKKEREEAMTVSTEGGPGADAGPAAAAAERKRKRLEAWRKRQEQANQKAQQVGGGENPTASVPPTPAPLVPTRGADKTVPLSDSLGVFGSSAAPPPSPSPPPPPLPPPPPTVKVKISLGLGFTGKSKKKRRKKAVTETASSPAVTLSTPTALPENKEMEERKDSQIRKRSNPLGEEEDDIDAKGGERMAKVMRASLNDIGSTVSPSSATKKAGRRRERRWDTGPVAANGAVAGVIAVSEPVPVATEAPGGGATATEEDALETYMNNFTNKLFAGAAGPVVQSGMSIDVGGSMMRAAAEQRRRAAFSHPSPVSPAVVTGGVITAEDLERLKRRDRGSMKGGTQRHQTEESGNDGGGGREMDSVAGMVADDDTNVPIFTPSDWESDVAGANKESSAASNASASEVRPDN